MPIDTEILGRFTTRNGLDMVSFTAIRESDGRNWAAPLWLVTRDLRTEVQQGLAVRIETDGDRISKVQRHRHQPPSGSTAAPSPSIPSPGTVRSQPAPAGGQQPASPTRLPYGFVPINPDRAVQDTPVWHDGSGGGELLAGEILCELEALTPLLPGNARYKKEEAKSEELTAWGFGDVAPKKQIAEPLRLPDKRVVIAGSALKGMIRHSLGALLSAPMERVSEHHFTYRPNLGHPGAAARLECRPAVITAVTDDRIDVKVLPAQAAIFIHGTSALRALRGYPPGSLVTNTLTNSYLDADPRTNQRRIKQSRNANDLALNHYLYSYTGGIDGTGALASAFAGGRGQVHQEALVPVADVCAAVNKTISKDILQQYRTTQRILADAEIGHLTNAHPLTKNLGQAGVKRAQQSIKTATQLGVNQLIYVEIMVSSTGLGGIQSFGHNYQYRWAYTSSVRLKAGKPRACLNPADCERAIEPSEERKDISPRSLTGARLLFGYVRDDETNLIGKGVFDRLAGRIAINNAVSVKVPDFLGKPENGYCVPLKNLGQPKSSAWEFYLRQDAAKVPSTYGDLPGDEGGELAGRKFYRHQPRITDIADISTTDTETIKSDQATLARYICAPGTKFRFAIRFTGLRPWELGALLVTLQPHRLLKKGIPNDYAHKLGLGRPLGMGSVRLNIDSAIFRPTGSIGAAAETDTEGVIENAVNALAIRLLRDAKQKSLLCLWLDIHSFKDSGRLDYPHGGKNNTIFDWHTDRRREYSKLRRKPMPDWVPFFSTINERKNFPSYHTENDFIDVV